MLGPPYNAIAPGWMFMPGMLSTTLGILLVDSAPRHGPGHAPQVNDEENAVMQRSKSTYELGREDYAWALGAIIDPPVGRGGFGFAVRAERAEEWLRHWVPGAIALVVLLVVAVFVARWFGATSIVAIAMYVLVLVVPGVWIGATWLWDRLWHRVDRSLAGSTAGGLIEKIERGEVPLPLGVVALTWDHDVLRLSGGGHVVEVAWSDRPIVRREDGRALVMPFVRGSGAPDVGRMAIVRSEAFADVASFLRAVEEWSSSARGSSVG
jgi:hypothetical protein